MHTLHSVNPGIVFSFAVTRKISMKAQHSPSSTSTVKPPWRTGFQWLTFSFRQGKPKSLFHRLILISGCAWQLELSFHVSYFYEVSLRESGWKQLFAFKWHYHLESMCWIIEYVTHLISQGFPSYMMMAHLCYYSNIHETYNLSYSRIFF